MKEILDRTATFPAELRPIKIQINRYLENNSNIDELVLNVLHSPWIASLNWGLTLYKEAKTEWFEEFTKRTGKKIPDFYKNFLMNINGGFIYDLSLYGLTPSLFETGSINRTFLQCHDLATANNEWITEYQVEKDLFYFASRNYTEDENVGYFWRDSAILCYRNNGELLKKWNNLEEMLEEEIHIAELKMLSQIPEGKSIKIL